MTIVAQSALWQVNAIALRPAGATVLVDSPVLPGELAALAARPQPDALAITHAHFDHVLARCAFPSVPLHAAAATRRRFTEALEALADNDAELYLDRPAAPDLSGARPLDALDGLEALPAPGHAPDGSALWSEDERTLACGDYLIAIEIPLISRAGDARDYAATLDRLEPYVRRADAVIPGHGPALTRETALRLLEEDRAYVHDLIAGSGRARPPRHRDSHRQQRIHRDNVRNVSS